MILDPYAGHCRSQSIRDWKVWRNFASGKYSPCLVLSIKIWAFHLFFCSLIFDICIWCAAYSLLVLNCLISFCCCWIWVLQVRELLHDRSSFKSQPNWVTVLDGSQEGTFQWVRCCSNFLQEPLFFLPFLLFRSLGLLTNLSKFD